MSYQPPSYPPGPPGPPGGYGYPPPGYGVEHRQGTAVLVLGILSLVVCSVIGPIAWSLGNRTLREIDAAPAGYFRNRAHVVAGRICGIIATILLVLTIFFIGIFFIALKNSDSFTF